MTVLSLPPLSRSLLSLANVLSCLGTFTLPAGTRLPNRLPAAVVALALELAQRRSSCAIVSIDILMSPPPPSLMQTISHCVLSCSAESLWVRQS